MGAGSLLCFSAESSSARPHEQFLHALRLPVVLHTRRPAASGFAKSSSSSNSSGLILSSLSSPSNFQTADVFLIFGFRLNFADEPTSKFGL